jgi:O-antigen ligase
MPAVLLLVISGAMPLRVWASIGPFRSFSIFDLVIVAVGAWLAVNALRGRKLSFGDAWVFQWLCVLPAAAALSILWTTSIQETLRSVVVYAEAIVAYITVCTGLAGRSSATVMRVGALFVLLVLLGSVLMMLFVPGFEPQVLDNSDFDDMVSYYTRMSHPFLGKSNDLAGLFAFFVMPFAGWAWSKRSVWYSVLAVLTACALLLTFSRGALLAVAVVIIVASFRSRAALKRLLAVGTFAIPVLGVLVVMAVASVPLASDYLEDRLSLTNIESRNVILDAAFDALATRPVLGFGAGAVEVFDDRLSAGVHNTYVEQMLSFGVPLGALCGLALFMVVLSLKRLCARSTVGDWKEALWLAALCQALIFLTETSFEGSILRILFYMCIAWGSALLTGPAEPFRPTVRAC